jgi:hypothetical protein
VNSNKSSRIRKPARVGELDGEFLDAAISLMQQSRRVGESFKTALQQHFADVPEKLVREVIKEYCLALKAEDPVEQELVANWLRNTPPGSETEKAEQLSNSIYLFYPAPNPGEPVSTFLEIEGVTFLRFVRTPATVERPLAVIVRTTVVHGKLMQSEQVLVYGIGGKWIARTPKEQVVHFPHKGNQESDSP